MTFSRSSTPSARLAKIEPLSGAPHTTAQDVLALVDEWSAAFGVR